MAYTWKPIKHFNIITRVIIFHDSFFYCFKWLINFFSTNFDAMQKKKLHRENFRNIFFIPSRLDLSNCHLLALAQPPANACTPANVLDLSKSSLTHIHFHSKKKITRNILSSRLDDIESKSKSLIYMQAGNFSSSVITAAVFP